MSGSSDWRPTPDGVEFFGFAGDPLPSLPVSPGSDEAAQPAVRLLEELWGRNLLTLREHRAVLPWLSVYDLDAHERATLGLPQPDERLRASVATHRWVSHAHFSIEMIFGLDENGDGTMPATRREGLLFEVPGGAVLPPREVGELTLLLDQRMPESAHERGILIANIQRIAASSSQIVLDRYLQNEDYVLPERLGLELEAVTPGEIRLRPEVEGVDTEGFRGFVDGPPKTQYTEFLPEGRRRRLFLRPKQRDAIRKVREQGILRGADVPAFFDNPEAFLPDEIDIDLAEFSERVGGSSPWSTSPNPISQWTGRSAGVGSTRHLGSACRGTIVIRMWVTSLTLGVRMQNRGKSPS